MCADLPLLCQCRVPGLRCINPRLPTVRTRRPEAFAMRALTGSAIWVRISCEFSARAAVVEEWVAAAAVVPVVEEWAAEAEELAGAVVVPVVEAQVVRPVVVVARAAVERAVPAAEPAAVAEPPEVVVQPAAGIRVDLIAILISTT